MRILLLISLFWQLFHLSPAQYCPASTAICPSLYLPSESPHECSPDSASAICIAGDALSWKQGKMADTASSPLIDYDFLGCLKPSSHCGYVKVKKYTLGCELTDTSSGVNIGAGIDLGQETEAGLLAFGVDVTGLGLSNYLEKKGEDARNAICSAPLTLTPLQVITLNYQVWNGYAAGVQQWYDANKEAGTTAFVDLPLGIRTVLTSRRWRTGALDTTDPFVEAILSNDFKGAADELRNIGGCGITDEQSEKEANVIEASLGCTKSTGIDCVFLIDESGSVNYADPLNYDKAKNWVVEFVRAFQSSLSDASGAKFGLASFDTGYRDWFELGDYSDFAAYETAIGNVGYSGGSTYLGTALTNIDTNQFPKARGNDIPKALIVMTDGLANGPTPVATPAATLKADGVIIIAVGIAGYDIDQLRQITTDEYIYVMDTFDDLDDILESITLQTCYVPTQLDTVSYNAITDATLAAGETQTFDIGTSSVTTGNNIILEITQNNGCVYVYLSYCDSDPYPTYSNNDVSFTSCSQQFKRIIVAPSASKCPTSTALKVTIHARPTNCNRRRRLQSEIASYDLSISTCNSAGVGCVNGTNYDPNLDVDPPYYIDETTAAPTTTTTNNGAIDATDAGATDIIPMTYVYAGAGIVVLIAVCCVCCVCYICCKCCGSKKSQEKEKEMNNVVHVVQVPATNMATNGYPGNYPPNTNVVQVPVTTVGQPVYSPNTNVTV